MIDYSEIKETIVKITSMPMHCRSSYGKWYVLANAHFDSSLRQWDYPSKHYYFWTEEKAKQFIDKAENALKNNQLVVI